VQKSRGGGEIEKVWEMLISSLFQNIRSHGVNILAPARNVLYNGDGLSFPMRDLN